MAIGLTKSRYTATTVMASTITLAASNMAPRWMPVNRCLRGVERDGASGFSCFFRPEAKAPPCLEPNSFM